MKLYITQNLHLPADSAQ